MSSCESAYSLAFHPVYRYSLFLQFIILITAVLPLTYFLWVKLRKSSFHGNLKWLLFGYFGSILAVILDFLILVMIQITISLISRENCSLIIPKNYYGPANISVAFFMSLPTFFPISITIERFFATKLAEKYDKKRVLLGPVMTVFVIFLNSLVIFLVYKGETFDGGSVNLVLFPSNTAPKMYTLFWVLLFANIINFFFNFLLLQQNFKLKKIDGSLSAKYQLEEVYSSSIFSISVIFLHIFFYGIYLILIMFSRYFGQYVITNSLDLSAIRGAQITVFDVSNLIIGLFSIYLYKKIKLKKSASISGTILMKSTGTTGARNYDVAIENIWNSHTRRLY